MSYHAFLACHITILLIALFVSTQSILTCKQYRPDTALKLYGPLSLANKYQMDDLRGRIITIIERDWPVTLAQWEKFNSRMDIILKSPDNICISNFMPEPASAIRLALECDVPKILPAAYYHLCRIHPTKIFTDERHANDNSRRTLYARWNLLSTESVALCLNAHMKYNEHSFHIRRLFTMTQQRDRDHHADGIGPENCRQILLRMCDAYFSAYSLKHDLLGSLSPFRSDSKTIRSDWGICERCATSLREEVEEIRSRLWNNLPLLFSLGKLSTIIIALLYESDLSRKDSRQ